VASGACFAALTATVPGLVGGGADLSGNTGTLLKGHEAFSASNPAGRQLYFGVREHAMGAIMNGMAAMAGASARWHLLRVRRLHAPGGALGRARQATR
jgi:transketolase